MYNLRGLKEDLTSLGKKIVSLDILKMIAMYI